MERSTEDVLSDLLVLKTKEGDRRAIQQLVELWQSRLHAHARRIIGDDEIARDIAQDAWMSIISSIYSLEDPARFRAWAFRIVTNKAVDWTRRQQRERRLIREARQNAEVETNSPVQTASGNEDVTNLQSAIRQLPAEQRALLSMFYIDQMPLSEIADALAIPVGTVKSRLFNSRRELKSIIEGNET